MEKRMFERFSAPVKVKYNVMGDGPGHGELKDISGGGIRLALAEKLKINTLLKLSFEIPGIKDPISIHGKVVWSKEVIISGGGEKQDYYETGITFLEDDPLKLGKIFEYFKDSFEENP